MQKYMSLKEIIQLDEVPFDHAGKTWVNSCMYTVSMEDSKKIEEYENHFDENHVLCWSNEGHECFHIDQMVLVDTDVIEKCRIAADRYLKDDIIVKVEERPFVPNASILGSVDEPEHTPEELVDHFLKRI